MKYTRQGKLQFTTKDPICAVQLLSMEKFMDTNVVTDIIWENVCSRFLIFDIPTSTPLEELAIEIQDKNDCIVVEMRRFLKQNSTKEVSPVLITILGTTTPEAIKIWFVHQRLQQFIDRPGNAINVSLSLIHRAYATRQTHAIFVGQFTLAHASNLRNVLTAMVHTMPNPDPVHFT
ncbi:hypothetical protein AVEN_218060-1 [Araneus ventricosus]|uniref:Uncharacterized protein n=1 Tax=Araneus ventricosus TaxID=182803 RepID=A0A4Y2MP32_ARAVE|nr:hypothetical protein AVEN_218060-1 [Araneus ventricosus]